MSAIYDNWERLVAAVIKKQQLWELFHAPSRTPSILSDASDSDSNLSFAPGDFSRFPSKLVIFSELWLPFVGKDAYLGSTKLLGRGTFGSVYSAAICDGATIVVKRLKSGLVSELDFKRHMDIVGHVRHQNVAPLHAYHSSKDERILLYDYYGEGSVYTLLHGQRDENQARLHWDTRLKIAIGVARGIAHIHTLNGGKLVHGNIKSSNILLNPQQVACVSDLGLASMLETSTFTPSALCYAPEVKKGKNISQASDAYSFGILLLELLTGKSCVRTPGGPDAVDLVKLINSSKSKETAAKIFDADLLQDLAIRDDMVEMLQIGIKCIAKSVSKRPKMSEVSKMLEEIVKINPKNHASLSQKKLVFVESANPTFDLVDIQFAHSWIPGIGTFGTSRIGTFGTSYKKQLKNGDTIVVKRLRDLNFTSMDHVEFLEIVGRVKHQNVAPLVAYCFSRDEKLLVHYYYDLSVSELLHGKLLKTKHYVDWKTRLCIAVGAARGIAHIHRYAGRELVHGNVKSSNIFLGGSECCVVYDFGLERYLEQYSLSIGRWREGGWHAPEVQNPGDMSQASDVYSFGVVLLELASGKMPQHYSRSRLVGWAKYLACNDQTALQVFDEDLQRYQNEERAAMLQFLGIAIDCVEVAPEDRPTMPQVVKRLEEILGSEPSIVSRLGYLLKVLLPTLTP